MTQHSPAPWTQFGQHIYSKPQNALVAHCPKDDDGRNGIRRSEAEANARLITAAPELLAALIEVDQAIQSGDGIQSGTMEVIREAIAKATTGV